MSKDGNVYLGDVLSGLQMACDAFGGQKEWAEAKGVSAAYLSDVLNRKRAPGKKILDAMGLKPVTIYKRK